MYKIQLLVVESQHKFRNQLKLNTKTKIIYHDNTKKYPGFPNSYIQAGPIEADSKVKGMILGE